MRHPFAKASLLCSPSIDAFPFSLDVSCTLIYISCCLTVYTKEKSNDERIDMKDLSSNECIIMTLIMNWLFEKHNTILLGYFGVQSLISFKARAQFGLQTTFLEYCAEEILRWVISMTHITVSRIASWRCVIVGIDDRVYRRSQIADRNIAISQIAISQIALNHNHCVLLMRCRISAVGDSLSFSF